MNEYPQRAVGLTMMLIVALLMALTSNAEYSWIFPIFSILIAILGVSKKYQWNLSPFQYVVTFLSIALLFASYYRITSPASISGVVTLQWYAIGKALLMIMVLFLFFPSPENKKMSPTLPLVGYLVICSCGQQIDGAGTNKIIICFTILYTICVPIYCLLYKHSISNLHTMMASTRSRILFGILVTSILLSYFFTLFLNKHSTQVQNIIISDPIVYLQQWTTTSRKSSTVGFSNSGNLSTIAKIKEGNKNAVSLRIFSKSSPKYLRGKTFDQYIHGRWTSNATDKQAPTVSTIELGNIYKLNDNMFQLKNEYNKPLEAYQVWPAPDLDGAIFTLLSSEFIEIHCDSIVIREDGDIEPENFLSGVDYTFYKSLRSKAETVSNHYKSFCSYIPISLSPEIGELAKNIFGNATTTEEKISRVCKYFSNNYKYHLGIGIPNNLEPMNYFLLSKPKKPAHCEYFATAAALLLRYGNVPTRYVTGFVTSNYNHNGGYWIAYNKDAHAWVEAWHQEKSQWITVEATVSTGVPQLDANGDDSILDFAQFLQAQVGAKMYKEGLSGVLFWCIQKIISFGKYLLFHPLGQFALLIILIIIFAYIYRRMDFSHQTKKCPHLIVMHKLLSKMDKRCTKYQLYRANDETIHHFANRIEHYKTQKDLSHISKFYRTYADARYNKKINKETVTKLKQLNHPA